jgi:hypothetical protein
MKNSTEEVEKPSQTSEVLNLKLSVPPTHTNLLTEESTFKPYIGDEKCEENDSTGTPEKSNMVEEKK